MKRTPKPDYWFKAKDYGWGWAPARWQGWLVLLVWVAVFAAVVAILNLWLNFSFWAPVLAVLFGFVWSGVLFMISLKTGEKPSWRWGKPKP